MAHAFLFRFLRYQEFWIMKQIHLCMYVRMYAKNKDILNQIQFTLCILGVDEPELLEYWGIVSKLKD